MTGVSPATRYCLIALAVSVGLVLVILLAMSPVGRALPVIGAAMGALIGWRLRKCRARWRGSDVRQRLRDLTALVAACALVGVFVLGHFEWHW